MINILKYAKVPTQGDIKTWMSSGFEICIIKSWLMNFQQRDGTSLSSLKN